MAFNSSTNILKQDVLLCFPYEKENSGVEQTVNDILVLLPGLGYNLSLGDLICLCNLCNLNNHIDNEQDQIFISNDVNYFSDNQGLFSG